MERGARAAREAGVSADERESQLSAMFDGELPDSECELLARRLSRDPALQQQWARYSLIGAVLRDEPLRARRAPGGRLEAGIAARLSKTLEAEEAVAAAQAVEVETTVPAAAANGAGPMVVRDAAAGTARWQRPAAGLSIAAGVAALSVFWLQARTPEASPPAVAAAEPARAVEVIAPPLVTGGAPAEIVVAGSGYLPAAEPAAVGREPAAAAVGREPESYVVPLPTERRGIAPPAQLANYVVAHSEYSGPLSRRNLLSALVAADAAVAAEPGDVRAQAPAEAAGAAGSAAVAMDETASSGDAPLAPGLRSAEAPK
jgi:sigma-E factor negative regulatory protein RseA